MTFSIRVVYVSVYVIVWYEILTTKKYVMSYYILFSSSITYIFFYRRFAGSSVVAHHCIIGADTRTTREKLLILVDLRNHLQCFAFLLTWIFL